MPPGFPSLIESSSTPGRETAKHTFWNSFWVAVLVWLAVYLLNAWWGYMLIPHGYTDEGWATFIWWLGVGYGHLFFALGVLVYTLNLYARKRRVSGFAMGWLAALLASYGLHWMEIGLGVGSYRYGYIDLGFELLVGHGWHESVEEMIRQSGTSTEAAAGLLVGLAVGLVLVVAGSLLLMARWKTPNRKA